MASTPNLLCVLINVAEKASNIARLCRANEKLLSLLVQEKSSEEANARFEHDFKTLADVLIQETIRYDVGSVFPPMRENIKGEESPTFTNSLGDSVTLCITDDVQNTKDTLTTILNGDEAAADVLANEVHRAIEYDGEELGDIPDMPGHLDYANLGIWIDPIDATAEYIAGDSIFTNFPGITSTGLDCVTVLIGVYEIAAGIPVIGVVSQPFHKKISDNHYESHFYWGVAFTDLQASNCKQLEPFVPRDSRLGIFSSSEATAILQDIMSLGYEFAFAAGAGHKALKVITTEVDLYLLTKGSTYKWDTCGPQAILRSLHGNMYNLRESVKQGKPVPLNYTQECTNSEDGRCNKDGLLAVRDNQLIAEILEKLANKLI